MARKAVESVNGEPVSHTLVRLISLGLVVTLYYTHSVAGVTD